MEWQPTNWMESHNNTQISWELQSKFNTMTYFVYKTVDNIWDCYSGTWEIANFLFSSDVINVILRGSSWFLFCLVVLHIIFSFFFFFQQLSMNIYIFVMYCAYVYIISFLKSSLLFFFFFSCLLQTWCYNYLFVIITLKLKFISLLSCSYFLYRKIGKDLSNTFSKLEKLTLCK